MKGTVKKWGNSAAVRIPAAVLEAAHVKLDQVVDVREDAGRIVIAPVRKRPRYTLDELVAQCNPKKRLSREEREWLDAPPVGREAL
ncbi:MAG TPA: AbrB/MazE/SpoVT family DNA-binding domain-containing protein [Bryobacteraceae bacterium]|nr:AbrB/MazE/SpoVT family DNA-binding domain-containing protein [Bryobacteraceae bacterium]